MHFDRAGASLVHKPSIPIMINDHGIIIHANCERITPYKSQEKNCYNSNAPFLITTEFKIKNNIRQIKMINIELKSM